MMSASPSMQKVAAANGQSQVWFADQKECPHGGFLTPSTGGWHNVGAASLSSLLVPESLIPPKYFLSSKACSGILRRAAKRGKKLPLPLEIALRRVCGLTMEDPLPV